MKMNKKVKNINFLRIFLNIFEYYKLMKKIFLIQIFILNI
jgi:hypothetical protein